MDCSLNTNEKVIEFAIRISVLTIALLSTLFVISTILLSHKRDRWPFRLLLAQSIAESIDLILAIIFSNEAQCLFKSICPYAGYIMHSSWLTSLLCSLTLTLGYQLSFAVEYPLYRTFVDKLTIIIIILYVLPYLFLLYLFMFDGFGPTGWKLQSQEEFIIFCGFTTSRGLLYFWVVPVSCIFTVNLSISLSMRSEIQYLTAYQELAFSAKRIYVLLLMPFIYTVSWVINFGLRISDYYFQSEGTSGGYYIYTFLNLAFELHLTLAAFTFYIVYNGFLNIDYIWSCAFRMQMPRRGSTVSEYMENSLLSPSQCQQES